MKSKYIPTEEVRIGIAAIAGGVEIGVSYTVMQLWLAGRVKLKPVPLTAKKLVEYGFKDNSYGSFYKPISDHAFIIISFKEYACLTLSESVSIADHDIDTPCNFVHELQNLYYDLTKKSL